MKRKIGSIILAAGKGKRMNSKIHNKVVLPLAGKPMVLHAILLLGKLKISPIIVVVGFGKKSVEQALSGIKIIFARQHKRLGTAHAVRCALKKLPDFVTDVFILQGDDSAFYSGEILSNIWKTHLNHNASLTFLTIEKRDATGLGRVIRDLKEKVIAIIEEKDADAKQRKIKEINPACYIFKVEFLKKYLHKVKKSEVSGEYYLTSLIDIAIQNNEIIETVRGGNLVWQGVNTREELEVAEQLFALQKNE